MWRSSLTGGRRSESGSHILVSPLQLARVPVTTLRDNSRVHFMYIELHARSAFSFLEGASLPEELIVRCAEFQMPAMALLDRDGVYGAPRFHMTAEKLGIRAHIGAEISLQDFGALENPLLRGAAALGLQGVSSGHQRDVPLHPLQRGNRPFPPNVALQRGMKISVPILYSVLAENRIGY